MPVPLPSDQALPVAARPYTGSACCRPHGLPNRGAVWSEVPVPSRRNSSDIVSDILAMLAALGVDPATWKRFSDTINPVHHGVAGDQARVAAQLHEPFNPSGRHGEPNRSRRTSHENSVLEHNAAAPTVVFIVPDDADF
jgi:hypothetical protein